MRISSTSSSTGSSKHQINDNEMISSTSSIHQINDNEVSGIKFKDKKNGFQLCGVQKV